MNFDLPKVDTININFELLKVSKMASLKICVSSHEEARNIKLGDLRSIIERVPLGTPPQAVVMSLAHNHQTNLFISNYRGRVAWWLATCARKPKVPGSSPAASYAQR